MRPGVIAYRVAAVFAAVFVLSSCGAQGIRVGLEPSDSPSATATASPSPSESPSPTTSAAAWVTYTDPQGRFSFTYPGDWYLTAPPVAYASGAIIINSYKPEPQSGALPRASAWRMQVEVNVDPAEMSIPVQSPQKATVAGQSADYMIWRKGDPPRANFAEPESSTTLYLHLQFAYNNILYGLNLITASDPPDADLDLFWKIAASVRVSK